MDKLDPALGELGLEVLAVLHPEPDQRPDPACRTLALIGPAGRAFWPVFSASAEYRDGRPDALDRWTRARLTPLALAAGGRAFFPFGGPPFLPFIAWALASGSVHASPVGLMVHTRRGLFLSFRAAIGFDQLLPLPAPEASPCLTCAGQPCRSACPVDALSPAGYNTVACHDWLDRVEGADCLAAGCRVRRACPVGAGEQDPARAAFHMAAFHPGGPG